MRKEKIIIGPPSDELLRLEEAGEVVVCELRHLNNLPEEELEEALSKEPAVWQYKHICIDASKLPQAYFDRILAKANGEPVIIGETERLIIRESIVSDAETFALLYEDIDVKKFLECPNAHTVAEWEDYLEAYAEHQYGFYEYGMWTVLEKESGNVVGRMGLELQELEAGEEMLALGYALLPEYRGKGYALEACEEILDYCKICGYADEVWVKIDADNEASLRLFDRLKATTPVSLKRNLK